MGEFRLTILGSNSAVAAYGRHPTAQFLQIGRHCLLIDCGEGTQFRLDELRLKKSAISHIFISHLHGDHFFGLVGLLTTLNLQNRQEPLHVFGPKGLEEIINIQMQYGETKLKFELHFHCNNAETSELILDHDGFTVTTIPLKHRVPTTGFLFQEKPGALRMRKDKIDEYQLSVAQLKMAKAGADISLADGRIIPNAELVYAPKKLRSYAFCSDTIYHEPILPIIKAVDLLYHESTFEASNTQLAESTYHSTTHQAANIARLGEVANLLIGHFSTRYRDLNPLLEEARSIFPRTALAIEGYTYDL
jgi:ribonuclease Z